MTAHCSVSVEVPVSSEIAGIRIDTAEVFAFTTSAETLVAMSAPSAYRCDVAVVVVESPMLTFISPVGWPRPEASAVFEGAGDGEPAAVAGEPAVDGDLGAGHEGGIR